MENNVNEHVNETKKVETRVRQRPMTESTKTSTGAETTLSAFAIIVLILGVIVAAIVFFAFLTDSRFFFAAFFVPPIIVVYSLLIWSVMKVFANISLTLKEINSKLEKQ